MNHELRRAGLKVTLPRLAVLRILSESDDKHFSVEGVYRALLDCNDQIGLATVYRVLTQLAAAGIVERHDFDEGHAVYELAQDEHHDHMVDIETGKIIEFTNPAIEALQQEIAEEHGVDLVDHALVLYVRKANGGKTSESD